MEKSHNDRVDELLEDADRIQQPSKELEQDIEDTREDWDAKKKAEGVPGAMKTEEEAEAEKYVEPNKFEFEERSPDTAEAQGPSALDAEDDDDSDDSDGA
jgi:hypothetical protein